MGAQVLKQPNGMFARFSSGVDAFTHVQLTEEEYIEYCAVQAAEQARRGARRALEEAKKYGTSAHPPFDVKWAEAVQTHLATVGSSSHAETLEAEKRVFEAIEADLPEEEILRLCTEAGWTDV